MVRGLSQSQRLSLYEAQSNAKATGQHYKVILSLKPLLLSSVIVYLYLSEQVLSGALQQE